MLEFVIFAVTIVIFLVVAVLYLLPGGKRVTTIPGPEPVDTLEGNFPDIVSSGSFHEFLLDLHQTYGSIVSFWWGPRLAVSIASPQLFKEHCKVFDRPVPIFEQFMPLIGAESIQYTNGQEGRKRSAAYSKCLTAGEVRNQYDLFVTLSNELITKWRSLPKDEHIPVRQYMMAYAIKAALRGLLGSFFEDNAKIHQIRHAYDFVWTEMEDRLRSGTSDMSSVKEKRFDEQLKALQDIMAECGEFRRNNPPTAAKRLVIDAVLELDITDSAKQNDLVTIFVAAFHTTGFLLVWSAYFLATHPDVQDKLHEEISATELDSDSISQLTYLQQVLDESLRCSKVAPFAARYQDVEIELGGHIIPAGTPVVQALGVVFDDPTLYPEPEKFDPERFSPENVESRPPFSFEPFGFAGKRKCPGYRFSLLEAKVLLVEMVRSFRLSLVEGQVITPQYGLVTMPKEEIWLTATKR